MVMPFPTTSLLATFEFMFQYNVCLYYYINILWTTRLDDSSFYRMWKVICPGTLEAIVSPCCTSARATRNLFVTTTLKAFQVSLALVIAVTVSFTKDARLLCVAVCIAQSQGSALRGWRCPSIVDCPLAGMDQTRNFAIDWVDDFSSLGMMIIVRHALRVIILRIDFKRFTVRIDSQKDLRRFGAWAGVELERSVSPTLQAEISSGCLKLSTSWSTDRKVFEFLRWVASIAGLKPQAFSASTGISLTRHAPPALNPLFLPAVSLLPVHFQLKGWWLKLTVVWISCHGSLGHKVNGIRINSNVVFISHRINFAFLQPTIAASIDFPSDGSTEHHWKDQQQKRRRRRHLHDLFFNRNNDSKDYEKLTRCLPFYLSFVARANWYGKRLFATTALSDNRRELGHISSINPGWAGG